MRFIVCLLSCLLAIGAVRADAPTFSMPHGIYYEGFRLYITSPTPGSILYYTDDGSDPRVKGQLYDGSLNVSSTMVDIRSTGASTAKYREQPSPTTRWTLR